MQTLELFAGCGYGDGEDELDLGGCWGEVSIAMIGSNGACKMEGDTRVEYRW